jgi:hypothetical protein
MMRSSRSLAGRLLLLLLWGCGQADPIETGADGTPDGPGAADAGTEASPPEGSLPDGSSSDIQLPADVGMEEGMATRDAPAREGGLDVDPRCGYLDHPFIVSCGGSYRYLLSFTSLQGMDRCPTFYVFDGVAYPDAASAMQAGGCGPCLYVATSAATIMRCGHRSGYTMYTDGDAGCGSVFETPDGIFSAAEWDEKAPCPPDGG